MRFAESINDAIALLETIGSPSHNVLHARGVVDLALNICAFYDADPEVVEIACWWHDTGWVESVKSHELLSASLAYENLLFHGFNRQTACSVYDAIRFHRVNSIPKTLEGRIVRDADKLDLISVPRWQQSSEFKARGLIENLDDRKHAIKIIPRMRNGILSLEKSKIIFDHMIGVFLDFLSTSSDPEIKSCFNELISSATL